MSLATQPTGDVTVSISVTDDDSGTVTVQTTSLTFTTGNWSTPQTVTVSAADDDNITNETATVSLTASDGDYDNVTAAVNVTVTDNDQPGLRVPGPQAIDEGRTLNYLVSLLAQPTGAVTVTVTAPQSGDVSVTTPPSSSLTFTTGNWSTAQQVAVEVLHDDDAADDTVSVTHTAAGGGYGGVTAEMMITVTDVDTAAVVAEPSPLDVGEGSAQPFDVSLATQPTGEVTVSISVTDDDGDTVSVQPTSLRFTATDWKTPKPVTVTADDDDDATDETATVTLTASGGDYDELTAEVVVTVTDDDIAALVVPESVTVVEEGSADFDVSLATEPSSPVTVSISVTGDDTVTAAAALTFTTDDWSNPQTVTVSAADDNNATDETATVTLAATGGGYDGVTASVPVTVIDNDTGAVVVDPTMLTIDEGESEQFDVRLSTEPSSPVNVRVSVKGDDGAVRVSLSSLAFTTDNWQTEQTVTVTALEDENATSEQVTLELTASDADADDVSGYDGLTAAVAVAVTDNDTPAVLVAPGEVTVPEGESGPFAVALATLPSDEVTVELEVPPGDDLSVDPDVADVHHRELAVLPDGGGAHSPR